jgi:hypothetical protein
LNQCLKHGLVIGKKIITNTALAKHLSKAK